MADAYEPKTEEGRKAIADGATLETVKEMEESGEFTPDEEQHIEKPKEPETKGKDDQQPKPKEGEAAVELGEDGKPKKPEVNRTVETVSMPAWKRQEELKKAREEGAAEAKAQLEADFQQKLQEAGKKEGGATDEDMNKIAEEFGLKPELVPAFIERIGGIVAKTVKVEGLKPEDRAVLDSVRETQRTQQEAQGFEKEWNSQDFQTALTSASGGKEVTAEVKAKVRELAYTEGYHRYRLADIVALEASAIFPEGTPTAERGKGGTGHGQEAPKSLDELTPEQILAMPAKEFAELSERLGGSGSRFTRKEIPKKNSGKKA